MRVIALDHLVLTVRNIERTCEFYERVLGMKTVSFATGRKAARLRIAKDQSPRGRRRI